MKALRYIIIIFVFVFYGCNPYNPIYLYSNYQLFEDGKYLKIKKYRPVEIVFTTDSTGCVLDYRNRNDTTIQYFKYKETESGILVITDFCGEYNPYIPLGNDTIIYGNKYLVYIARERGLYFVFYRKRKSGFIPTHTINR